MSKTICKFNCVWLIVLVVVKRQFLGGPFVLKIVHTIL